MRLTCPNCDAQYEVSAEMIPAEGRDVQCSSCGHVWFQSQVVEDDGYTDAVWDEPNPLPVAPAAGAALSASEFEDEADEAPFHHALDEDAPPAEVIAPAAFAQPAVAAPPAEVTTAELPPVAEPEIPAELETGRDSEDEPAELPDVADTLPRRKPLDEGMLSVLREEAERESRARAREAARNAPRIPEIQADLGLPDAEPPVRLRIRPRAVPAEAITPDPVPDEPVANQGTRSPRRELLPNIDEINSTLDSSHAGRGHERAIPALEASALRKTGFRSGFLLVLVLAAIGWMVYAQAPTLAEKMPQMRPTLDRYVGSVDAARLWVNAKVKTLLSAS